MWKSLHQDESYHRSARKICLQDKKMGRASTEQQETHLASNWLPCSPFNKGGCSLPRRNKQTTNTMHKRGWRAFLAPLTKQQVSLLLSGKHPEIFWDRKPWLVDTPDQVTKSQETAWPVQPYGYAGKASGTCKVPIPFSPALLPCPPQAVLAVGTVKTTQAGEGKWNPILIYRKAHNKRGGHHFSALKLQPWEKWHWQQSWDTKDSKSLPKASPQVQDRYCLCYLTV